MKVFNKNTINIILLIIVFLFTFYGTYNTFVIYKTKQSLMFWIIEVLHHFITLFVFIGLFIQDKSFYFIMAHLLTTIFILFHWYFNLYILKKKKCILTVLSNQMVNSECDYIYHNPVKQFLTIDNSTNNMNRSCKSSYLSNKPETIDVLVLGAIIIYDVYLLMLHK